LLENQNNCGRILASFQFLEANMFNNSLEMNITPKTEKYIISIKILGLRGLKSLGLFPVSRPFIKFDINGMKTNEKKETLEEKKHLQTQPTIGSNPNICTILNFELDLPIEIAYCPYLNVFFFLDFNGFDVKIFKVYSFRSDFKRVIRTSFRKFQYKFS